MQPLLPHSVPPIASRKWLAVSGQAGHRTRPGCWHCLLSFRRSCRHLVAISLLARTNLAAAWWPSDLTCIRRMTFYEELPDQCPPEKAKEPSGAYFRLVHNPTLEEDFHSHKLLGKWPKCFANASECDASSISLMDTIDEAVRLTKLPTNKGKKVLCINLVPKDGLIMQTGRNPSHHSWWRSTDFCIRESSKQLVDE